jgi:hypothetical protein
MTAFAKNRNYRSYLLASRGTARAFVDSESKVPGVGGGRYKIGWLGDSCAE